MEKIFGIKIKSVEWIRDYILKIEYENGEEKFFDGSKMVRKEIFKPLSDPKVFSNVVVTAGGLTWLNEIDIAGEYFYQHSKEKLDELS